MIRQAKLADAASLRRLVKKAWESGPFARFTVDDQKLTRTVHEYLSHPQTAVFVSVVDSEVKGLLAASISLFDIAKGKTSTDHCFYCESGEGAQLIRAYVRWAKERDVNMINLTVSSNHKRADQLIEREGFTNYGGNFYRE